MILADGFADVAALGEVALSLPAEPGLLLYRNQEWSVPTYEIFGMPADIDPLAARIRDISGQNVGIQEVGFDAVELLRVESGVPKSGKEITDQVNPLEAGLGRFISSTKGCYIGQEVVARLDTYKKLQRTLKGFIFPEKYQDTTPGTLIVGGTQVGWTTSHVLSAQIGKHVALGYIKIFPEPNSVIFTTGGGGSEVPVDVVELPLVPSAGPFPTE